MADQVLLANGEAVPAECVEALDKLATVIPGATRPEARGVIVAVVLEAAGYHIVRPSQEKHGIR